MINKENLQHFKNVAESLAKEIAEFEKQNAAPVDDWPMTVEDLPENKNFWFIKDGETEMNDGTWPNDIGDFAAERDAKSALAFAQLSRLIRHVNKGWEPDWPVLNTSKHCVSYHYDKTGLYADFWCEISKYPKCLYFKNQEDAQRSIETWRKLWLDYFQVDEQK